MEKEALEKLTQLEEVNKNLQMALTISALARENLEKKLKDLEFKYFSTSQQFEEQQKVFNGLEKEVNDLRKYKAAVEFGSCGEEEAIRIARERYCFEDQAKIFYEALLMKKADLSRSTKQLRYKEIEIEELKKKIVTYRKQFEELAKSNTLQQQVEKNHEEEKKKRVSAPCQDFSENILKTKDSLNSNSLPPVEKEIKESVTYTSKLDYMKKRFNK